VHKYDDVLGFVRKSPQSHKERKEKSLAKAQSPPRIFPTGGLRIVAACGVLKKWLQEKTNTTIRLLERWCSVCLFLEPLFRTRLKAGQRSGATAADSLLLGVSASWRFG
jgi:hypothetical protein